jgi:hypothetical protein
MNCPNCGAESTFGLNYCKQCGSNLVQQFTPSGQRLSPGKLTGMFWAIAVFGLAGLAIVFGTAVPMMILGSSQKLVVALIACGTTVILAIAALLIKQLSRLISLMEETYGAPKKVTGRGAAVVTPQLGSGPRAVSSVTEQTTRNFEPAANYREPEAK